MTEVMAATAVVATLFYVTAATGFEDTAVVAAAAAAVADHATATD